MNFSHAPHLTAEQWSRTSIKRRVCRLKDLRKYMIWCMKEYGSDCNQIRFALGQVENIKESIALERGAMLLVKTTSSIMGSKRLCEYGTVGKFENVKCWFSRTPVGRILGEAENDAKREFYFVVNCRTELGEDCFSTEQRFTEEECDFVSDQQYMKLLVAALCLYEDWCIEKQAVIDELEKFANILA